MGKSKKKKVFRCDDFQCDYNSFYLDEVLRAIKKHKKSKKQKD